MTEKDFKNLKEGDIIEDIMSKRRYFCASDPFDTGGGVCQIALYEYTRNGVSFHADTFKKVKKNSRY